VFRARGLTDVIKGFDGLAVMEQHLLMQSPRSGAIHVFRGKRGGLIKLLW